jgi:urea transport system substrate-binding protein
VRAAGTAEVEAVKKALYACRLEAPQGPVWIDPDNNHSFLTPAIGVSRADGQFDIAWRADVPMKPDPYLVWFDPREFAPRPAAAREAGYPRAVQP